ncbi:adenosylcobinamide-GDP ribazoletransferase [Corynebacterium sp. ES2794-CONJ1]|uniref:adenosylcobinamide-GDP ribazoletransferase n=1 Tax=unclassified Corynebacterium TaxID=2624378 RepID=UPI0021693709|nr:MULTISPECIES: adenosylcobinamide-GDP ribazoletransferase [unclassified Corynebacterium]MCS4488978.1 adenosylcobinamide-GDP ribazoletransferase [Corynebacterium sp. ES2775-CONJ]MCS4531326.1 adenosylcobinamide-GDP ribazoletransferase [Corynebacterium sp. ES2730-CONJ]MCU9518695.1 adenosylcobinamide-GDP ribazoletransferase [Corynebacterium sp. ES2794-CONJ1]
MSGKAHFTSGEHQHPLIEGPLTALSWLTVLPIRGADVYDRVTGTRVMLSLPLVGALFGCIAALLALAFSALGVSSLLGAVIILLGWELANRFMHLDGLSDMADALGSYADSAKARLILDDPHTGSMGAAAIVLVFMTEVAAMSTMLELSYPLLLGLAPWASRICTMVPCLTRFSPIRPTGFGGLIIGTIKPLALALWSLIFVLVALCIQPSWVIMLAYGGSIGISYVLSRYCDHRLAGLNGDACGFIQQVSQASFLLITSLGLSLI